MRVLFLTKSKPYTLKFLEWMVQVGVQVIVVSKDKLVLENTKMKKYCEEQDILVLDNEGLYREIKNHSLPPVDLAISNTFGRLIKKDLIDFVAGNCFNFHCAILPDYKGLFVYNHGIFNGEKEWGVTAHYVNEKFDEGDIIEIRRFSILPQSVTIKELEEQSQSLAYKMSVDLISNFKEGKGFCRTKQDCLGKGRYYSKEDFEQLKKVTENDDAETIRRKIHACWCPPYEGAYIERDGVRFELKEAIT